MNVILAPLVIWIYLVFCIFIFSLTLLLTELLFNICYFFNKILIKNLGNEYSLKNIFCKLINNGLYLLKKIKNELYIYYKKINLYCKKKSAKVDVIIINCYDYNKPYIGIVSKPINI